MTVIAQTTNFKISLLEVMGDSSKLVPSDDEKTPTMCHVSGCPAKNYGDEPASIFRVDIEHLFFGLCLDHLIELFGIVSQSVVKEIEKEVRHDDRTNRS